MLSVAFASFFGLGLGDGVSDLAPDTCASDDPLDGITWEHAPALGGGRTRFGCKNGMGWEDTCEAPCACKKECMETIECNYYAGTKVSGCFFFGVCDEQSETPNYSQKLQTWHKLCPDPTPPPTEPPVDPPTEEPVADPTPAPVSPTEEPVEDPTPAPVSPTEEPVEDPTPAPVAPTEEPVVDPTPAPEPECADIVDPCECTGKCGWSSDNDMCMEDKTTTCQECPTMEGCDASNCIPAEKCGQYDAMRVCQCTSDCEKHDNCCPDVDQCGTDETCHAITKHKDCKPAPGCWWQFDDKICITFDELVDKIRARPCTENVSYFQCMQNTPDACTKRNDRCMCGWYFGSGHSTGQCMNADDIPCDNAKTEWNCNKRAPRKRPDGKFADRVTTKKIRCMWDAYLELCITATGGPKPCDTLLLKAPCESQAFRGCVWDGQCHDDTISKLE